MYHALTRFQPSAFGDAGGAGARTEDRFADQKAWLRQNSSTGTVLRVWADGSGHVFVPLGESGVLLAFTPDAKPVNRSWLFSRPEDVADLVRIVDQLRRVNRPLSQDEYNRIGKGEPVLKAGARPASVVSGGGGGFTASIPPTAAGESLTAPKKGKKRRRPQKKLPLYQRTWFPFAIGGGVLAVIAIVAFAMRKRAAAGAKQ